jgi:hypothetical protein
MEQTLNIVEEMDKEIQKITGGKPKDYDLQVLFKESQEIQKALYGGGENNGVEQVWLEGLKTREAEIEGRRIQSIEETEEVEELDFLGRDGIYIRK